MERHIISFMDYKWQQCVKWWCINAVWKIRFGISKPLKFNMNPTNYHKIAISCWLWVFAFWNLYDLLSYIVKQQQAIYSYRTEILVSTAIRQGLINDDYASYTFFQQHNCYNHVHYVVNKFAQRR